MISSIEYEDKLPDNYQYLIFNNTDMIVKRTDKIVVSGDTGPQGVKGETGARGSTGPQGDTGARGLQGVKGDTGPVGGVGPQGVRGDTGPVGDVGPQGVRGDTGPRGSTGPQGVKGDMGPVGNVGLQGIKGDTGAQGIKGNTGAQGIKGDTGVQGVKGDTGAQGVKGDTGARGSTGASGAGLPIEPTTGVFGPTFTGGQKYPLPNDPDMTSIYTQISNLRNPQTYYPVHFGTGIGQNGNPDITSIVLGNRSGATTNGPHAISIGTNAGNDQYAQSISIGTESGFGNQGTGSVNIGWESGRNSTGRYAVNIGCQAGKFTSGTNSINIGYLSGMTGGFISSISIGSSATSRGNYAISMGNNATVSKFSYDGVEIPFPVYGIAMGANSSARRQSAIAIGYNSSAKDTAGISIGENADLQSPSGIVIGKNASSYSTSEPSISIGASAYSEKGGIGIGNTAYSENSVCIGKMSSAYNNSIVVGSESLVNNKGISIGYNNGKVSNNGTSSIMIGNSVNVPAANSIMISALGLSATNDIANSTRIRPIRNLNGTSSTRLYYNSSTGEIHWGTETSSRRYKTDVVAMDVDFALKIDQLKPVRFRKDGRDSFGLIAEDVEPVFPEAITYHPETGSVEGINYDMLIAPLILKLNQQSRELSDMRTRLFDMEKTQKKITKK